MSLRRSETWGRRAPARHRSGRDRRIGRAPGRRNRLSKKTSALDSSQPREYLLNIRTEIHLEGDLLTEAECYAIARGATLQALVEEALRLLLKVRNPHLPKPASELPTWGAGWLRTGVDLDKGAALRDLMDQDDVAV